jgi:hypothetical protein
MYSAGIVSLLLMMIFFCVIMILEIAREDWDILELQFFGTEHK